MKPRKFLKEAGQAATEFAIIFPIFMLILFFIVDFGWVAYQRASFEYGYMQASWTLSAADLGDDDPIEMIPSEYVYTGVMVAAILEEDLANSSLGIIRNKLEVSGAKAKLYNKEEVFDVPGHDDELYTSTSRTRYMDIDATFRYDISPITYVGKMFFGSSFTVEKRLERTRVVGTNTRTE